MSAATEEQRPAGLEYKASSTAPDVGLLDTDDATGVVEAIVSVTGVRDHDDDIIEPGAYAKTLTRRTPKGVFHHDWHKWASKTLLIQEWMPGDSRLPKTTKDGKTWPADAGALYVKTQYNLATTQGRDAFENVKFYGPECEWSVGYRVPSGKSTRGKDGVRHIKEIDLFEYSPVLFGANSMSSTLAVKSLDTAESADIDEPTAETWQELDAEADAVSEEELADDAEQPDEADQDGDDEAEEGDQEEDAPQEPGEPDPQDAPADDEPVTEKRMGTGLDRSPKKNWVEMAGRLPAYIEEIAKSIHEKRGMPISSAIPIAIATVKKWARGGDGVNPDTQAKAAKAVAEWEKLKASSHAHAGKKDDQAETVESTLFPHLPGTYEELREQIRQAAAKTFANAVHVEVMGTWPDHAVLNVYAENGAAKAFEVPYSLTVGGDTPIVITLAEPEPVELLVSVDGQEEAGEEMLPFPSQIEDVTSGVKAWLTHSPQTKAGRVLSAANERRLLGAVESLVAVLKAAGLEIDARPKQADEETSDAPSEPVVASDSTAPSARPDAKTIDPTLLARGYRVSADASARRW